MDNTRQRRNLTLRRISEETSDTEQSSNISTTQENLVRQGSNLFTITYVRSLSEQNYDDDLTPTNQELDVSSSTKPDSIYTGKNANQSNQPNAYFPVYWPDSVNLTDENTAYNNISATIKEGTKSRSTEENPDIVLDNTSNWFRSNKIDEQENDIETVDNINDEFISFEERLTNHLRQMPLRNALLLQNEIQGIIALERLKCLEEQ